MKTKESKRLVISRRVGERVVLTPAEADGGNRRSAGDPQPARYRVELQFLQIDRVIVIALNAENCRRLVHGQGDLHLLTSANEPIVCTIQERRGSAVSVLIEAPETVRILRGELDDGSKGRRHVA